MRLWSLHPMYLDAKGLVALWREGLLARKVLRGLTKGYTHHPQLQRFRKKSISVIDEYLRAVYDESLARGYTFNARKIGPSFSKSLLAVSRDQLQFEWNHLKSKLRKRDRARYRMLAKISQPKAHPMFKVVAGKIAPWERSADNRP